MIKTIKIKNVEYAVKPGMKAIMIFEKLTDEPFKIKTTTDILSYIYSSALAAAPECRLDFNEMIEAFDEDPKLFAEAIDCVLSKPSIEKVVQLSQEDGGPEPKKE